MDHLTVDLDKVISNAIKVMEDSKYQIYEICESARSELEALELELGQVLEETVKTLRKQRTVAEVRTAMVDRIARAPLSEFETLKTIYLRYCGDERE